MSTTTSDSLAPAGKAVPVPLRRAVGLLNINKSHAVKAVLMGVISLGSSIALAAVSAWLIARASQMPPVMQLSVATVAVRTFGISRGVFRYLERLATHSVALQGMASLRTHIYARLATGDPAAAASLRKGDLLARVSADVDAVGDVVVRGIIPAAVAAVLSAGSVVFVGCFHIPSAIALAVCLLLAGVVAPWLAQKSAKENERDAAAARSDLSALTHQMLTHGAELSVAGSIPSSFRSLEQLERKIYSVADRTARLDGLAQGLSTFALVASALIAAVLGIPSVVDGSLAPVELAVIVLTPLAVFEVLQGLPAAAVQIHTSRSAATRIMSLLDESGGIPQNLTSDDEPVEKDAITVLAETLMMKPNKVKAQAAQGAASVTATDEVEAADEGADSSGNSLVTLRAQNLSTGWPQRTVLENLSLTVKPGSCVALVGPSGTGKTTTLMTLAGLLPPKSGAVYMNDQDVATVDIHEVTKHVAFIAEDSHIFETTVLENLRVARGTVTVEETIEALDQVGLTSWLEHLPQGVDTVLGANGTTISGGERRRLLIARALCSTASVLLIDEPAEHLDPATADALISELIAMNTRFATPRSLVIATHRLTPMAQAQEILILEQGRVTDRGTHTDLVQRNENYRLALAAEASPY